MDSRVHAIVFSKDRAWQLQQLLKSLFAHAWPARISVLYTTTSTSENSEGCGDGSYLAIASEFSDVEFVREQVMSSCVCVLHFVFKKEIQKEMPILQRNGKLDVN